MRRVPFIPAVRTQRWLPLIGVVLLATAQPADAIEEQANGVLRIEEGTVLGRHGYVYVHDNAEEYSERKGEEFRVLVTDRPIDPMLLGGLSPQPELTRLANQGRFNGAFLVLDPPARQPQDSITLNVLLPAGSPTDTREIAPNFLNDPQAPMLSVRIEQGQVTVRFAEKSSSESSPPWLST